MLRLLAKTLFVALLALPVITSSANTGAAPLTMVYTGPLRGELEPCGCTLETDFGGIRRLATMLEELRIDEPELLLVGIGAMLGTTQPVHTVTNEFILSGLQHLEYDAIGLDWGDLVYGIDPLTTSQLPWVATNWQSAGARPWLESSRVVRRDGIEIIMVHWLAPANSPHRNQPDSQHRVSSAVGDLARQIESLRSKDSLVILGTDSIDMILDELPAGLVDILLLASPDEQFAKPVRREETWILRAGIRGQRIGKLNLKRDPQGRWLIESHHVIALDDSVPDSPRLANWYEQYEQAIRRDYQAREQLAAGQHGLSDYVGDSVCGICHAREKAQWQQTRHARAYDSLVAVGKQFDANCVGCHVVGFAQPGGFLSSRVKPDLRQVGCEACHGPARIHQLNGGTKPLSPVTEAVCTNCHNPQHSPGFDAATYWPQVNHGKSMQQSGLVDKR